MNIPGFKAEASLGSALGIYGGVSISEAAGVLPMQGFTHLDSIFRKKRCCQFVGGKFQCVEQVQRPGEVCRCVHGFFGPVILCKDAVLTQG